MSSRSDPSHRQLPSFRMYAHPFNIREYRRKFKVPLFHKHWNHLHILWMEGFYGLLFCTAIIALIDVDAKYDDSEYGFWKQLVVENVAQFLEIISRDPLQVGCCALYIVSEMLLLILMETSKSYLTGVHAKCIYLCTAAMVWGMETGIYYLVTNTDIIENEGDYGDKPIHHLWRLQGGGMLLIALGVCMYDERYIVYINGYIEHCGSIMKEYKVKALSKYWLDIYKRKEKERLCGFAADHVKMIEGNGMYDSPKNGFDIDEVDESRQYHELSVTSAKRDGTKLEGTLNLLIGDSVNYALTKGPEKYYPSYYS